MALSGHVPRLQKNRHYLAARARPGTPVSVPIDWTELGSLKSASQYTVPTVPQRLARLRKDPLADIGRLRQLLPKSTGQKARTAEFAGGRRMGHGTRPYGRRRHGASY
jgi:hypothetical protein